MRCIADGRQHALCASMLCGADTTTAASDSVPCHNRPAGIARRPGGTKQAICAEGTFLGRCGSTKRETHNKSDEKLYAYEETVHVCRTQHTRTTKATTDGTALNEVNRATLLGRLCPNSGCATRERGESVCGGHTNQPWHAGATRNARHKRTVAALNTCYVAMARLEVGNLHQHDTPLVTCCPSRTDTSPRRRTQRRHMQA